MPDSSDYPTAHYIDKDGPMRTLALSLVLLVPVVCHSAEFTLEDGGYRATAASPDQCLNLSTATGGECMLFFENETVAELASAWKNLTNAVTQDRALLEASQERWEAYADAQCALESVRARSFSSPDSYAYRFNSICHSRLRILRTQELRRQQTGCDPCLR